MHSIEIGHVAAPSCPAVQATAGQGPSVTRVYRFKGKTRLTRPASGSADIEGADAGRAVPDEGDSSTRQASGLVQFRRSSKSDRMTHGQPLAAALCRTNQYSVVRGGGGNPRRAGRCGRQHKGSIKRSGTHDGICNKRASGSMGIHVGSRICLRS